MSQAKQRYTVMFADVAGSTRLYEKLGDEQANIAIHDSIAMMSAITEQCNGVVIKTIGDEIMARFDEANHAITAACQIQDKFEFTPTSNGIPISIRIGLHTGPALLQDDGDIFGDAVNVAARMAGIARARQIITSKDTIDELNSELKEKCREFDLTEVKGKSEAILIFEVVWEQEDVTRMTSMGDFLSHIEESDLLELRYHGTKKDVAKNYGDFSIGRGAQCDLVVTARNASRIHAKIEYRRGKFILIDHSTNGTYVITDEGKEVYLRREELPLTGKGRISLGERIDKSTDLVYFKV